MEPLEVVEQIGPRLVASSVLAPVHALPLEHPEKALAGRVVGAVADRAHAADQGMAAEVLLVVAADELPAAIRVQDHLGTAFPLPHRHLHGAHDHVSVLAVVHRPAHHQLAVQVDHHTQVQLAFLRLDLGDVGDPTWFRARVR